VNREGKTGKRKAEMGIMKCENRSLRK